MKAGSLTELLPQRIERLPREGGDPLSFEALRASAIEHAQQASGQLWTDYNLHDPGVTLLEALCYALTEDVFATRRSVPELLGLAEPADETALARHALLPARRVMHCRPCSADDYLRWLHEQLPAARHLGMRCDAASGRWRLSLQAPPGSDQAAVAAAAATAYWQQRNLGEDLAHWPQLLKPRWVSVEFSISVHGERDLVELLGELMQRCDEFIAAQPQRHRPEIAATGEPEDGPALEQGAIDAAELRRVQSELLYLSDLTRSLQGVAGLESVQRLQLREPGQAGGAATRDALPWRDLDKAQALALRWPESEAELKGWQVLRSDTRLPLPTQALLQHLADLRRSPRRFHLPAQAALPLTANQPPEDESYYPASAQLPLIYSHPRLLRWHSDDQHRESDDSPGRARQWLGYLALLEQPLAQVQAQRQHLGALYALDAEPSQSYWWQLLGDAELPGLDALYRSDRRSIEALLAAEDSALERRGRVLDHLLALHGEALSHSALQGLPRYLPPLAWEQHLHALKRQLAEQVQRHTEQRYAGIDYSRPSFDRADNTAPLQERLSLQLAFAHSHSRSLSEALREAGLRLAPETRHLAPEDHQAGVEGITRPLPPLRAALQALPPASLRRQWAELAAEIPLLQQDAIDPALLRCAAQWERYQIGGGPGGSQLLLGPDEARRRWTLAQGLSPRLALALARRLHAAACRLQRESEGLHLVEHVLLRPCAAPPPPGDRFFQGQQLSLVFPAWTARCASRRFRRLAAEAAEQAAPAHLQCRLLWLDAQALHEFEVHYQSWLAARQRYCAALPTGGAELALRIQHLDRRSAAVVQLLRRAGQD